MLDKLLIRNYKILKNISMISLERVNLITGKNNVGKTSLLEVIGIYASQMNLIYLFDVLKSRKDIYLKKGSSDIDYKKSFLSFFSNRTTENLSDKKRVLIKTLKKGSIEAHLLFLKLVAFTEDESGVKSELLSDEKPVVQHKTGIKIGNDDQAVIYSKKEIEHILTTQKLHFDVNCRSIAAQNTIGGISKAAWDYIVESDKKNVLSETLKMLDENIAEVTFQPDNSLPEKGNIVLKLQNQQSLVSPESMGIGIVRVLNVFNGLFEAKNGFLLIDEFETGFHYAVLEKLWEIVFKLSKELNVQVFATTQSYDCIQAFGKIINGEDYLKQGKMIRLERHNDDIQETDINADELSIAIENNIDLR